MKTTLLLNKAGKEVERAKTQAAVDAKAAQLAHELARVAKVNLKHARKLSKLARKSARKSEDRAEESSATLETVQAKLEMLRQRIRNEQRKTNPSPKPKLPRSDDDLPHNQPKSKPAARNVHGTRRSAQKTVKGKPAQPAPAIAPESKSVPATPPELG
jgi:rubrerythrin